MSHILNVAFGLENVFPELFIYKTVSIQDHPDADLLLHIQDCCDFIQQAHSEVTYSLITTVYIWINYIKEEVNQVSKTKHDKHSVATLVGKPYWYQVGPPRQRFSKVLET